MTDTKRGFQCDASWHLWEHGALTMAVYAKIAAITYDGITGCYGTYYGSGEMLADFFGAHPDRVTLVLRRMAKDGWLRLVGAGPGKKRHFKPKDYQYVTHAEWAKRNPGKCYVREAMPWDDEEHDPLAQSLHKVSLGKSFWHPNMLAAIRSSGMPDDELSLTWHNFLSGLDERPTTKSGWRRAQMQFIKSCKAGQLVETK
jgi:hypothetical protein